MKDFFYGSFAFGWRIDRSALRLRFEETAFGGVARRTLLRQRIDFSRSISAVSAAMRSSMSSNDSETDPAPSSWVIFFLGLSSSSPAMLSSCR
jgi:hypothetical protein